jgi:hypothetical protein
MCLIRLARQLGHRLGKLNRGELLFKMLPLLGWLRAHKLLMLLKPNITQILCRAENVPNSKPDLLRIEIGLIRLVSGHILKPYNSSLVQKIWLRDRWICLSSRDSLKTT